MDDLTYLLKGILNDVTQLNCEITRSQKDLKAVDNDPCSILKRIIKVRSRIQSKLQREQYKCNFLFCL